LKEKLSLTKLKTLKKNKTTKLLHKKVKKKLPYFSKLAFQAPEVAHGRRGGGDTTPQQASNNNTRQKMNNNNVR
jgi:hypothetical protein